MGRWAQVGRQVGKKVLKTFLGLAFGVKFFKRLNSFGSSQLTCVFLMCNCRTKLPPYIFLKMEVEDKTYVIKFEVVNQVATKKIISYVLSSFLIFKNYITNYISDQLTI